MRNSKQLSRGDGTKKSGWGWKVFRGSRDKLCGMFYTPSGIDFFEGNRSRPYAKDKWHRHKKDSPGFCLFTKIENAERYRSMFPDTVIVRVRYRGALTSGSVDGIRHAITAAEIFIPSTATENQTKKTR